MHQPSVSPPCSSYDYDILASFMACMVKDFISSSGYLLVRAAWEGAMRSLAQHYHLSSDLSLTPCPSSSVAILVPTWAPGESRPAHLPHQPHPGPAGSTDWWWPWLPARGLLALSGSCGTSAFSGEGMVPLATLQSPSTAPGCAPTTLVSCYVGGQACYDVAGWPSFFYIFFSKIWFWWQNGVLTNVFAEGACRPWRYFILDGKCK